MTLLLGAGKVGKVASWVGEARAGPWCSACVVSKCFGWLRVKV